MRTTIGDIAAQAGVSKTTVSRVLNKKYEFMSEATRLRVLQIIEESGYVPNNIAKSLKMGRTFMIGVIVPNLHNLFYPAFINGVGAYCKTENFQMILGDANDDPRSERKYLQAFKAGPVDGLIVCSVGDNVPLYKELLQSSFPMVFADREVEQVAADLVTVDDYSGACDATRHLASLGHRRIGLVIPPLQNLSTRSNRLAGYKKALQDHGLPFAEDLVRFVDPDKPRSLGSWLVSSKGPTAVFATNSLLGLHVISQIHAVNRSIPQDIAVVVFDETPWSQFMNPPITTVAQPAALLGNLAAELLIKRIEGRGDPLPRRVQLEPELVVRQSCGSRSEQ